MKYLKIIMVTSMFLVSTGSLEAYEPTTHEKMAEKATEMSDLDKPNPVVLLNLGLKPDIRNPKQKFPNSDGKEKLILDLIKNGANFEDNDSRPLNHFYDPISGKPLSLLLGHSSPDWALEDTVEPAGQDYSYKDAREYFFNALTETRTTERKQYFGLMFQTLGQVIHHIHDMAQPQHTRLDAHLDIGEERVAKYPLENPSHYEYDTYDRLNIDNFKKYNPMLFLSARDYWHTDAGTGLADYSNRGFVSAGTNFDAKPTYPLPPFEPTSEWETDAVEEFREAGIEARLPDYCTAAPDACVMTFYRNYVNDRLRPNLDSLNEKTSTFSIFNRYLEINKKAVTYFDPETGANWTTESIFSLNRFNHDEAHKLLIPRAIGYSAGLIDYFFRGRLEISLPDEGVYGIVDHAVANQANIQGFNTIKLKIKNTTPDVILEDDSKHPQPMTGGKLVAVAKFKRNTCYDPSLVGEFRYPDAETTWNNCTRGNYRSETEKIVVSQPVEDVSLTANATEQYSFTFDDPIPINATNLYLQVVYRGPLGEENDAVVVATKDIFEPTYYTYFNGTDFYMIDGVFKTYDEINNDPYLQEKIPGIVKADIDSWDLEKYKFWFEPGHSIVRFNQLEPGKYVRFVYLTDRNLSSIDYTGTAWLHNKRAGSQRIKAKNIYQITYPKSIVSQQPDPDNPWSMVDIGRWTYYWFMDMEYDYYNVDTDITVTKEQLRELLHTLDSAADLNPQPVAICFTDAQKNNNPDCSN